MAPFSYIFVIFLICYCTYPAYAQQELCPYNVEGGYARVSDNGRLAEFFCHNSYVLVGHQKAVCMFDKWTPSPPICAKMSCPPIPQIEYGKTTRDYEGAISHFKCDPGFVRRGPSTLACLGNGWNGSLPLCQAESLPYGLVCSFDVGYNQSSCNWKTDPPRSHAVPYFRQISWRIGPTTLESAPSFDHSLQPHTGGNYLHLYEEGLQGHPDNQTARYISPIFPAVPTDESWCFIFWLYSNDRGTTVRVLVNNETRWNKTRESNRWSKVIVSLREQTTSFRIIIEGSRPDGFTGHSETAIDDLQFTNGTKCEDTTEVDPYPVEPYVHTDDHDDAKNASHTVTTNSTASHPTTTLSTTAAVTHVTSDNTIAVDKDLGKSLVSARKETHLIPEVEEHRSQMLEGGDLSLNKTEAQAQDGSHSHFHIMGTALILVILSTVALTVMYLLWKRRGESYAIVERHRADSVSQSELLTLEDVTVEPNQT